MRIIILLSHPAQFHFFKNPIIRLREKGHTVFILIKTKDILSKLLDEQGWDYYNILPKEKKRSKFNFFINLIKRNIRIFQFAWRNNIQLLIGSDASIAQTGKLLRIPCITTTEDDYYLIKILAKLTFPFTKYILMPIGCNVGKWDKKKIGYNGYMKLSYLHPNIFKPDRALLKIPSDKSFFLIRLSGLNAHHDYGIKGISEEVLDKIINKLEIFGKVFISSEKKLPDKYETYLLKIPVSDMHHYLFYSEMLICDSQSMAVEAAMLGTPSLRISSFAGRISVLEELEYKYNLTFGIDPNDENKIFEKIDELLNFPNIREEFQERRNKMLSEKIDVAAFLTWLIDSYPESITILKENPDYQNKFIKSVNGF